MALFELTDLAALLQRDLDTATATVARDMATGVVTAYTGQNFESQSYSHTVRVGLDNVLKLPQRPVTAVTSVSTPDDGTLDASLWNWIGNGPWVALDVVTDVATVAYVAGFATVPEAVKAVALSLAARHYQNAAGLKQERIDDYSVTYSDSLMRYEMLILDGYRSRVSSVVLG